MKLSEQGFYKVPNLFSLGILYPNLKSLDLSHNHLLSLEGQAMISCLPNLEVLNVSFNLLCNMEEIYAFDGFEKLRELDMRGNRKLIWEQMNMTALIGRLLMH